MNKNRSVITIGLASLITFFTMLLLTSFSTLIVSSARNDLELSKKTAQSVEVYYQADYLAEHKLSELANSRTLFFESEMSEQNTDQPLSYGLSKMIDDHGFSVTDITNDGVVVVYDISINDDKILAVEIFVPSDITKPLVRHSWQAIIK